MDYKLIRLEDLDLSTITTDVLGDFIFQTNEIQGRRFKKLSGETLDIVVEGILRNLRACQRMNVPADSSVFREIIDDALNGKKFFPKSRKVVKIRYYERIIMANRKYRNKVGKPSNDDPLSNSNKIHIFIGKNLYLLFVKWLDNNEFIILHESDLAYAFGGCAKDARVVWSTVPKDEFNPGAKNQMGKQGSVRFTYFSDPAKLTEKLAEKLNQNIPKDILNFLAEHSQPSSSSGLNGNYGKQLIDDLKKWIFKKANINTKWKVELDRLYEMAGRDNRFSIFSFREFTEFMFQALSQTSKAPDGISPAIVRFYAIKGKSAKEQVPALKAKLKEFGYSSVDESLIILALKANGGNEVLDEQSIETSDAPSGSDEQEPKVEEIDQPGVTSDTDKSEVKPKDRKTGMAKFLETYFDEGVPEKVEGEIRSNLKFNLDAAGIKWNEQTLSSALYHLRKKQASLSKKISADISVEDIALDIPRETSEVKFPDSDSPLTDILRYYLTETGELPQEYPNKDSLYEFITQTYREVSRATFDTTYYLVRRQSRQAAESTLADQSDESIVQSAPEEQESNVSLEDEDQANPSSEENLDTSLVDQTKVEEELDSDKEEESDTSSVELDFEPSPEFRLYESRLSELAELISQLNNNQEAKRILFELHSKAPEVLAMLFKTKD